MQLDIAALRWLNELSSQGILITDAELCIRGWNNWLENHTGHRAARIIGQCLLDVYPDLKTRGLDKYYNDALAGQIRVISHRLHGYILPLPPGLEDVSFEYMQQSARIAPVLEGERVIGTITVIEDVTERVDREDKLVRLLGSEKAARADAEAANRAKDEFLATVSHELRTPLNSILGWVQILRNQPLDTVGLEHGLEAIERNARAQTSLIGDILDASRIITGKLQLHVRPLDVSSVVEESLDTVRPAAEAKSITIIADLRPLNGLISGDPNRLQQMVWNLLSNAIKFTPKGGRIEIRLERIDSEVELTVKDTGQGINAAFLPFVFDRFRQADNTSARLHGGLGLGLAIVRHLVEMHGGTVKADSAGEGLGATFTVRLPFIALGKPEDSSGRAAALVHSKTNDERASIQALKGVRVLVVDDEADAREMLTMMLKHRGVDVRTAATAGEALTTLETWKPDILVSDIGMPSEDGYSLISRLRALASDRGGQIPAVALTGYAGPDDRKRLTSAGYQRCIAKPVDFAELTKILTNLTKGSTAP
jgi:signal transduction histidine kinase/ActR/RegA family two-component response regulator